MSLIEIKPVPDFVDEKDIKEVRYMLDYLRWHIKLRFYKAKARIALYDIITDKKDLRWLCITLDIDYSAYPKFYEKMYELSFVGFKLGNAPKKENERTNRVWIYKELK